MKKKLLSLALVLVLAVQACLTSVQAASFSDVTSAYDWAKEAIERLSNAGIVKGYPDGTFMPGNNVSKQEAIVMLSRMMGYSDESNSVIAAFASDAYADEFTKLTTYASGEMSYLIYKQILSTNDISTYLNKSVMDVPAKRYEAAVLIAKCLGADAWLKDNPEIEVSFADKADIPESALPYVQYASNLEIIKGMDENKFEPNGNVTRAQIATMIQRMMAVTEFTYLSGVVSAVDSASTSLTIKLSDGTTKSYNVIKGVTVMVDGEKTSMSALETGMSVVVTSSMDALWSIDAFHMVADGEVKGVYVGSQKDSSKTTITIKDVGGSTSTNKKYVLAADVVIEHDGKKATLTDFSSGDYCTLTIKNDKVSKLEGSTKAADVKGCVIEEILTDPTFQLKVSTSDNDIVTYEVAGNATVNRNGSSSTFSELAVGDRADLTLEYDRIVNVKATGKSKTLEGTISEITLSKTPSIKITSNGETTTYTLDRNVKITLDGSSATAYDLRLDYQVKVKLSSNTVTEIEVQSVTPPTSITGTISLVNAAYNMIVVTTTDSSGGVKETQIFIRSDAKILDSATSQLKKVKDLQKGMTVMAAGGVNLGVFEASSIMIVDSNTAK